MRIAMLGPLEVQADDRTPVEITGARLRTLLILLTALGLRVHALLGGGPADAAGPGQL